MDGERGLPRPDSSDGDGVEVDWLAIAVPNAYKHRSGGKQATSGDYANACGVADAVYGHSRVTMPYRLIVIGY